MSHLAAAFELRSIDAGRFSAHGALTFATARQACEEGAQALTTGSAVNTELDCSGITASDSAGLAVLIEWLALIKRSGRHLRYARLPIGLIALAHISELEQLLGRGV